MPFENIVGEGENAGYQHFLIFPAMFSTHPKKNFSFSFTFILSSANAFILKICGLIKSLDDECISQTVPCQ